MSTAFRLIGTAVLALSFSACGQDPTPRPVAPAVPKPILVDISAKLQLGRKAIAAQRFGDAVAVLTEAVKLRPDDTVARQLLDQAKDGKRKDDFATSLKSGEAALKKENYETAFAELSTAAKLMPDDQDANALLKQAEFLWRRQQGRAAMDSKRFRDAVTAFTAALKLQPDDAPCRTWLGQAQAAQLQQDIIDGNQAKTAGKAALDGNRVDDAVRELDKAKRLLPGDTEVEANWRVAHDRKSQRDADALAKKRKQDYDGLVSRARISLASRRYDDAISACRDAERLIPGGDAAIVRLSAETQQRLEYSGHITKARNALLAKRPDEALRECDAADNVKRSGGETAGIRAQARVMQQPPITITIGGKKK